MKTGLIKIGQKNFFRMSLSSTSSEVIGKQYVRRPQDKRPDCKYQVPTIKYGGGGVMVLGAFSAKDIGPLVQIHGKMYTELCTRTFYNVIYYHMREKI